ncbi:hypothetical protein CLU79DRAFT_830324 [Phycomyces nitens]|nr:hypothetical protein CLU79DRAFT_830324 [Phycomyces nitens]
MAEEIPCLVDEFDVVVDPPIDIESEKNVEETLEDHLWDYTNRILFEEVSHPFRAVFQPFDDDFQPFKDEPVESKEPDEDLNNIPVITYTTSFCCAMFSTIDQIISSPTN